MGKPSLLSFTGAGFMGAYYVGVAAALKSSQTSLLPRLEFAGASAGALIAAALASDVDVETSRKAVLGLAAESEGKLLPGHRLMFRVRSYLDKVLPEDAHLRCQGRLHVAVTDWSKARPSPLIVDTFADREELIASLLISSFIPGFATDLPPPFRGHRRWVDGGFTNMLPIPTSHSRATTLAVSPFTGDFDICPTVGASSSAATSESVEVASAPTRISLGECAIDVSLANLKSGYRAIYPAPQTNLQSLVGEGYDNAQTWIKLFGQ